MNQKAYKLCRISLLKVSAYLLYRPGEAILVDCGRVGSEVKILQEMGRLGLQPTDLGLLILTHAHYDHAGAARRLKEICGCRIMIHESEASRLQAGKTPIPGGTRWKAKVLVFVGRIFARRLMKYPPARADILVGGPGSPEAESAGPEAESVSLEAFNFPGKVIHSPGHTPGSMVVLMEGGEMLTGDSLFGLAGKRIFPPFAEDPAALMESWKLISTMPVRRFFPAHGASISPERFLEEFMALDG